mgnify:FL=1|tara:strand:- start:1267 stop:1620 length:354 start_codon:yes stop_codon:yes gene_type:complete
MNKKFIYKNQKSVKSRFGGTMYYLFFNDGQRSFRTCVDTTFRNFVKWERLIKNATRGDIVLGLVVKSKGMIDADSTPRYGGNIFKNEDPKSNCCDRPIKANTDICSDCGEHTGIENI